MALLFVDLDHFKLVNDSLGHAAGDSVLRQSAERLAATSRVVAAFQAPFPLEGAEAVVTASVTASVGVAVADPDSTPAELLRDADTATYRAKNGGRNAAAPFTPELRAITLRRVEIEPNLRPALERGQLELYFQPLHTIAGDLCGFEALSRWPLPRRGTVPPDEFIPVAEATGLIGALTGWALDAGLEALARWRAHRHELDLPLAVNVAPSLVRTASLRQTVADTLARHDVPAHALCLEITESALVVDDDSARGFFTGLRDLGVRLSIDDFGTGFSSLAYLTQLPVDELKIDRAFINGLPGRTADVAVVSSIVGLAHQLGLVALAEGVETEEQLATVRRLGCDLVQGYLLGRPMPAEEVDRFLHRGPSVLADPAPAPLDDRLSPAGPSARS